MQMWHSLIFVCYIILTILNTGCINNNKPIENVNRIKLMTLDNINKTPFVPENEIPNIELIKISIPSYKLKYKNGPYYFKIEEDGQIISLNSRNVKIKLPSKNKVLKIDLPVIYNNNLIASLILLDKDKEVPVSIGDNIFINNIEYNVFDIRFSMKKVILVRTNDKRKIVLTQKK